MHLTSHTPSKISKERKAMFASFDDYSQANNGTPTDKGREVEQATKVQADGEKDCSMQRRAKWKVELPLEDGMDCKISSALLLAGVNRVFSRMPRQLTWLRRLPRCFEMCIVPPKYECASARAAVAGHKWTIFVSDRCYTPLYDKLLIQRCARRLSTRFF